MCEFKRERERVKLRMCTLNPRSGTHWLFIKKSDFFTIKCIKSLSVG